MKRLTWVQPADLLAHELVASAHEGKPVDDVRERWASAGGVVEAPVGGAGPEQDALAGLALELLDELDARPVDPGLLAREPDEPDVHLVATPVVDGYDDRLLGAWTGRAAGCLLGKPVEKIPRAGIREILTSQGRWPLSHYFTAQGLPDDVAARWPWNRRSAPTSLVENIDGMPVDDDLEYPMLGLAVLEQQGHDFTTGDVADAWLANLPGGRVFTAERVAYRNLLLGLDPPATALRHNPFREWIGAFIRADVHGWTHPGDPATAAAQAGKDARLSHVRTGVYGARSVAAMCATAVAGSGLDDVLAAGLAAVPSESRYAEALAFGVEVGRTERDDEAALDALHDRYGHLHWVHTLNNAALAGYALAASEGDFERAVCLAVTGGWDTDSVGATVGSVTGALAGAAALPERWTAPLRNRVASSLPGFDGIALDDLARRTAEVAA